MTRPRITANLAQFQRHKEAMGRTAFLLPIAIWLAAASARADDKVDLNGTPLNLVSEDGFCALSDQDPNQHAALEKMRQIQSAATNQLLAWYLKCDATQMASQGMASDTSESIQILVNKLQGAVRQLPLSRDKFIEQTIKELGGVDPDKVREMMQGRVGDAGINVQLGQMKSLGVIYKDQNAAYTGIVQHVSSGQNDVYIASVIGFTEVQGYPINIDFFHRFVDQGTIDALLKADRDYLDRLVAANDSAKAFDALPAAAPVAPATAPPAAVPPQSGFDWSDIVRAGVIGGLVAAAGVTTWLILRRR